jgi:hypothetical protein
MVFIKMKIIILVLLFVVLSSGSVFSQDLHSSSCGTKAKSNPESFKKINSMNEIVSKGGKYLPAKGTVKALVVFVQFKEDNYETEDWKSGKLPNWSVELPARVKKYFSQMSINELDMDVDIYPECVKTDFTEWNYLDMRGDYGMVNKEILAKIDKNISFLPYDNWKLRGFYDFLPGQDNQVDLIIMIYRRITNTGILRFSGIADLGFIFLMEVDEGKRIIWGGYNMGEDHDDASASGITICNSPGSGQLMTLDIAEKLIVHEASHKLFGEGHYIYNWASLGLMSSAYGGEGMQAFERALLNYTKFIKIDSSNNTVILNDYMTTGEAGIITIPGVSSQYYILENRQKLSPYDGARSPGLYIYQLAYSGEYSSIDIQSADGKWDWKLDSANKLVKVRPNPINGKSHLEIVPINGNNYYPPDMYGNEYDAFYSTYKTLYAPWTNPCSNAKINSVQELPTNVSISLLDKQGSALKIKVSFNASQTDIKENQIERKLELRQNYPNPFNYSTRIEYNIPFDANVKLEVYNILGQNVYNLFEGIKKQGNYLIDFHPENLASGIYYYKIIVNNLNSLNAKPAIETRKLILLK